MKTRYYLFLTSCLCGLALSFAYITYAHSGDGNAGESTYVATDSPSAASSLDEQTAFNVATRLVSDRDAALIAHDHAALQALTVPDSPARIIDDALFERIDDVSALNTVVLDVRMRSATEWEVYSVQQEISTSEGSSGSGQERCTLWRVEGNPWRLYETSDCA